MTQTAIAHAAPAQAAPAKPDDVAAMLAAMKKLADAALNLPEDVRTIVDEARDAAGEAISSLEGEIEAKIADLNDAEDEVEELREIADDWDGALNRLARIYRDIEAGRTSDALHALDDVLCRVDSAWRTRA